MTKFVGSMDCTWIYFPGFFFIPRHNHLTRTQSTLNYQLASEEEKTRRKIYVNNKVTNQVECILLLIWKRHQRHSVDGRDPIFRYFRSSWCPLIFQNNNKLIAPIFEICLLRKSSMSLLYITTSNMWPPPTYTDVLKAYKKTVTFGTSSRWERKN